MNLPRLYPIIDLACFASEADPVLAAMRFAESLLGAGATMIQIRDKSNDVRRFLSCARELRRITRDRARLIINDRADLCIAADADGVHLGQDDLSPEAVRQIFNRLPSASTSSIKSMSSSSFTGPQLIGFSTHNRQQIRAADDMPVDYIAIGPVFATGSKANPDPVVGIEGVRQARAATRKPLVAIGGITRKNCLKVIEAGADSVAVVSDLLDSPVNAVEEFRRILG